MHEARPVLICISYVGSDLKRLHYAAYCLTFCASTTDFVTVWFIQNTWGRLYMAYHSVGHNRGLISLSNENLSHSLEKLQKEITLK